MDARELEGLSREELIVFAETIGILRPSVLTRAELIDEILRCQVADPAEQRRLRGLLGMARDLLASVVERGLHLPEAAAVIRGPQEEATPAPPKAPLATVMLAEIYEAQGHRNRALAVLDQILAHDPKHPSARGLREQWLGTAETPPPSPPEPKEPEPRVPEPEPLEQLPLPTSSSAPLIAPPPSPPAEQPVPMLDDEPLPPRYEVDEIVALPVDPRTLYVYWEVREETLSLARAEAEDGKLVVRVVAVTATWEGPVVHTRDIEVQATVGDWFVRDLPEGAIVRAALGWQSELGFGPFAVALEIGAPPAIPSPIAAGELARFVKDKGAVVIDGAESPRASAYARAVLGYRRKLARTVMASVRAAEGIGAGEAIPPADLAATGEKLSLPGPKEPTSGGWAS